jgi:hypothetical protein
MSQDESDLAREHAARAARQAKHATRNVVEAVGHEKDAVADSLKEAAKPINPPGFFAVMSDVGSGVFATMVALGAAAIATHKFRAAYASRGRMVTK